MTLTTTRLSLARNNGFTLKSPAIEFRPGEIFGILGPNGAGKSTLLNTLAGHLTPDSGSVMWSGSPREELGARRWAQQIAYISQESAQQPELTLRQFVELGRVPFRGLFQAYNRTDQIAVDAALDRCGIASLAATPLTELSGGQRQRTKIARALAQEPRVLLLDEPTNHLDLAAIRDTMSLLRDLATGQVTLIMSLHDLDLAAVVTDRVAIVERGQVQQVGRTTSTLTAGSIEQYWGVETLTVEGTHGPRFLLQHNGKTVGQSTNEPTTRRTR